MREAERTAGVCAADIQVIIPAESRGGEAAEEIFEDPQVSHLGMPREIEHPERGVI